MKTELIAIPVFEDRISPLLDVAERFTLIEVKERAVLQKFVITINGENERIRIEKLKEMGVELIISGAVSRYLAHIITGTGIRLIPWISGPVDDVINSFISDTLESVFPAGGSCGGMMRNRKPVKEAIKLETEKNQKREII